MCVVDKPSCRRTGPSTDCNYCHYYETWYQHHEQDNPHIKFCAIVCLFQIKKRRAYLREQPRGTWVDQVEPWPEVLADPNCQKQCFDQCTTGAVNSWKEPVRKSTEMMSNRSEMLTPFKPYQCKGDHVHGQATGKDLKLLQHYTPTICNLVVDGLVLLKRALRSEGAFPTSETGSGPSDPDPPPAALPPIISEPVRPYTQQPTDDQLRNRPKQGGFGCQACRMKLFKENVRHTRNPDTCTQKWTDTHGTG